MQAEVNKINTLYLVDDDKSFQFLAQEIIEPTNLVEEIKIFSNGLEALNFLKSVSKPEELPEIILLDINMPVMDGWEFLAEFMPLQPKLGKKIAIYIVSSSISPADMQRARATSLVTDYIIKPVSESQFIELVRNLKSK
ncbi:MAG: response regulator [Bacteroidetes bacterium]|nr:response regulator [Bacteroidota bacterium]